MCVFHCIMWYEAYFQKNVFLVGYSYIFQIIVIISLLYQLYDYYLKRAVSKYINSKF